MKEDKLPDIKTPGEKNELPGIIQFVLFLFFITGLIFSLRAVSSISTGLLLISGLVFNRSFIKKMIRDAHFLFFISACFLYFLLQVIALLYTQNQSKGISGIQLSSGVVLIPLAIYSTGYLNLLRVKKLLWYFCVLVAIASLYCLLMAYIRYNRSGDSSLFFYHQLVSPLKQHAVFFSILVYTAIVFCGESVRETKNRWLLLLIIYFSVFIFLLSSKLVIVFLAAYLFYFFSRLYGKGVSRLKIFLSLVMLVSLTVFLLFFTKNPVSHRFREIINGKITMINRQQFGPDDYFNDVQFRLLQWKLVPEILTENRSWLAGVSPGDAQDQLNKKYLSKKMYAGDPQKNDGGYLLYNTHNQFLQSFLETGITGLLVFIFLWFAVLKLCWQYKKIKGMSFLLLLLLAFSFTESVLKTQYGIVIFTFLPLLVYFYKERE